MAGVWKKTLNYLGLVEEDEDFVDEMPEAEPSTVRRMRPQPVSDMSADAEGVVRTIAAPRPTPRAPRRSTSPSPSGSTRLATSRTGSRSGAAVIMNLQSTEDATARRLVDFASGLVYGLDGKIELIANRVYLLSPADVEVSRRGPREARGRRLLQPVLAGARSGAARRLLAFPPDARCRQPVRAL